MQITVEIPDRWTGQLAPAGMEPSRAALEAMAIEAYRQHRLSGYELQQLLGFETRYQLDGFLKEHQVWLEYTIEDFRSDREASERLQRQRQAELAAEASRQRQ